MTIEQADKIADIILSAPTTYETPPTKFPDASGLSRGVVYYGANVENAAWLQGLPNQTGALSGIGVFFCKKGFGAGYEQKVTDWEATPLDVRSSKGRYVTIDDLKMMAYVGIENYRSKLLGHRWRFNEKGVNTLNDTQSYFRGAIIRDDSGRRWIKCTANNDTTLIPGVQIGNVIGRKGKGSSLDPYRWAAFTRGSAFKKPIVEHLPLLDNVNIPFEKVTRIVKAATIVGNNDLVQLRNVWDAPNQDLRLASVLNYFPDKRLNEEGEMIVRISEEDGLDNEKEKENLPQKSIVWATSNSIPIYSISYTSQAGNITTVTSFGGYSYVPSTARAVDKFISYKVAYKSSFIPLSAGRTYYVYIERRESRAGTNRVAYDKDFVGGNLTVVRTPLTTIAPKF